MNDDFLSRWNKKAKLFYQDARGILGEQDQQKVDKFFSGLINHRGFSLVFTGVDFGISEEELEKLEDALRTAEKLHRHIAYGVLYDRGELRRELELAIAWLKLRVSENHLLKTGGRRSELTAIDMVFLKLLQDAFADYFPNLAHQFKRNNILHKLGKALLGKSIPESVNQKLEEQASYTASFLQLMHQQAPEDPDPT